MHLVDYLRVNTLTCVHSCMSTAEKRNAFILSFARVLLLAWYWLPSGHACIAGCDNKRIKGKLFMESACTIFSSSFTDSFIVMCLNISEIAFIVFRLVGERALPLSHADDAVADVPIQ